jgi:pimeloyl-ACP methyl ester carboxylesterase
VPVSPATSTPGSRWPTWSRAAEVSRLLPNDQMIVDPDAAHYPWITGPRIFTKAVDDFLC